jgi:hypothetical protein
MHKLLDSNEKSAAERKTLEMLRIKLINPQQVEGFLTQSE